MPHPIKFFYRHSLPHIQPVGECFFVTFRLHGSLPASVVFKLKKELDRKILIIQRQVLSTALKQEAIIREQAIFFKNYDRYLDQSQYGIAYLKEKEIADIVVEQIHRFDKNLYELIAYCIMPNHVHLLISTNIQLPNGYFPIEILEDLDIKPLYEIMRRIKGASAKYANDILKKKGTFWQHESYDHYVRNTKSFRRVIAYIANNPVAAKLVHNWEDWPYTYVAPRFL